MPSTSGFANENSAAGKAGHALFRARAFLSACPAISTPERRAGRMSGDSAIGRRSGRTLKIGCGIPRDVKPWRSISVYIAPYFQCDGAELGFPMNGNLSWQPEGLSSRLNLSCDRKATLKLKPLRERVPSF
jgi:hypothetical protein